VTGPAGAGRTTAIKAIEDFGVEAIDNLPLNLVSRILFGPPTGDRLAIGVDSRTRGFSPEALLEAIDNIDKSENYTPTLLYLDCRESTLLRRYSETRRRHPASPDGSPAQGIKQEVETLSSLRDRADILVDTSELSPHQLRAELARWFDKSEGRGLSVAVQSFSYKRGTPRAVDMMIDCRFLRNPHWESALRPLTGLVPAVGEYVSEDPLFQSFFDKLQDFVELLLPAYQAEGKAYFSIGMGCTGGQHRSVFVAEKLAAVLAEKGWMVSTRHKEMEHWPAEGAQK
jgi:UPF0042 nucleotide-binding protein